MFMAVFQKSGEHEEHIHRDEIESLTDDNRRATAEPDPHSSVFDSRTKCGPVTRIFPHNMLHAPYTLAHILT